LEIHHKFETVSLESCRLQVNVQHRTSKIIQRLYTTVATLTLTFDLTQIFVLTPRITWSILQTGLNWMFCCTMELMC